MEVGPCLAADTFLLVGMHSVLYPLEKMAVGIEQIRGSRVSQQEGPGASFGFV